MTWGSFVCTHGRWARADHLAAVLGQPAAAIRRLRSRVPGGGGPRRPLGFAALFALHHGRPPREDEWPRPRRHKSGAHEWQPPELALVARLSGRLSVPEIAGLLTNRLRRLTGDPLAGRSRVAVQNAISRLGLHASEPIGGLSTAQAGRAIGSSSLVYQALAQRRLRAFRVGRRYVIPRRAFSTWRATRDLAPPGWVRLTTVRAPLGIRSDSRLPEYAKLGYVPGAVFVRSSHLWFVAPEVARRLVDDARAGRPLPWHGQPLPTNLRATWRKWQARKHRRCPGCRRVWGPGGPPRTFEAFARRYPALSFGAKRHLTWRPGLGQRRGRRGPQRFTRLRTLLRALGYRLVGRAWAAVTIAEAARRLGKPIAWVRAEIRDGVVRPLRSADPGAPLRLSTTALRRLEAVRSTEHRGRPPGLWLGVHAAARHAGVSIGTVQTWGRRRLVAAKPGRRGRLYSLPTLERQARAYWRTVRFKRAVAPAWISEQAA